jgi:hypothetical protein
MTSMSRLAAVAVRPRAAPSVSDASVDRMRAGPTMSERWRRGKRGWPEGFPVAQLPNAPLLVALGGLLVGAATRGPVHAYARSLFYVGLAVWAWEEMVSGANWVRRALGAAGFLYVVAKLGAALGA